MYYRAGRFILVVITLATLAHLYYITDLRFNYNFEDFFPINDPDLAYYEDFRAKFENDNEFLLIGIESDQGIFNYPLLSKIDRLVLRLTQLPQVSQVLSLTDLKKGLKTPTGFVELPYIHLKKPELLSRDSIQIYGNTDLRFTFLSNDSKSLLVVVKHNPLMGKPESDPFIKSIKSILSDLNLNNYHLAGKALAQGVYLNKMRDELFIFLSASMVLVIILLVLTYRSWWGVIVPIGIVILSIIWLLGFMGFFQKPLDILLVLLPTIMFVVGMSDVIHLLTKYLEELRRGSDKFIAIKTTVREIGMATFLTSLTTAVGFLTLFTASIRPIRDFGLFAAIGVFIAFFLTYLVLPSLLIFLSKPTIVFHHRSRKIWTATLRKAISLVLHYRLAILNISTLIVLISIYGIFQLNVNSYLIEDVPRNDPLKLDFIYFDQKFGGSRPFEMTITPTGNAVWYDDRVIAQTQKLENYLKREQGTSSISSPNTLIKSLNMAVNGKHQIPTDQKSYGRLKRYFKQLERKGKELKILDASAQVGRISSRLPDQGSDYSIQKRIQLQAFIKEHLDPEIATFKITGTSLLIDNNNFYLAANMMKGLAIAFLVVALIAGIMFGSLRMILITLIPNIIPLLMVAGIMGLTGIDLKLSTSIVFTIAFGIAVDDTIHFISKLKIELSKGKSVLYAIKRTYFSTGKAIIVTSIILSGGFLSLILSSFGGTFYTGLLVSLTLIFALIIDLTLLPVLVLLFYKKKRS